MSIQKPSYVKFHGIAEATFSRQQLILIVLHAQIGAIIMLFVKYRLCEWMKPLTEWMLIDGVNPRLIETKCECPPPSRNAPNSHCLVMWFL